MVAEDKSMNQMIETGKNTYDVVKLAKLAKFRDELLKERNIDENRVIGRNRRGKTLIKRPELGGGPGKGPYNMEYRADVLDRLLSLQEESKLELISKEEVDLIKVIWAEEVSNLAKLEMGAER